MEIASEAPASFRSSARRPGAIGLIAEAGREVLARRRLIRYLVAADIKKKGADSVLGNVWWVLDPVLQMLIYMVLLTVILRRPTPDAPLFLLVAILPWKWFTSSISDAVSSVVKQERLIKQIQFPKIVLPVAAITSKVVNFLFGLIPLGLMLVLFYPAHLSLWVVLLPVVALVQYAFTAGLALLVAAVNVFYRDVGNLMTHLLRLWFYMSPALWSFDLLDERGGNIRRFLGDVGYTILQLNPFAIIFTAYRDIMYGRVSGDAPQGWTPPQAPDFAALGVLFLISLALVVVSTLVFKRLEPAFAKVL